MAIDLAKASVHHLLDTGELGGGNLVALMAAKLLMPAMGSNHLWLDPGPAEQLGRDYGLTLHPLKQAALRSAGRLKGRFLEWQLGGRLAKFRPGIVHVSSAFLYGLTSRAVKRSGLKRIVHVQIEDTLPNWQWAFREPPDAIVTCAKFLAIGVKAALPEHVRDRIPIIPVCNGVAMDRFTPGVGKGSKQAVNAPTDRPLLLMLANLAPHKGQRTAIECVLLLKQQGIDVECWLAGTERGGQTEYTKLLTQMIAKYELTDRVKLLGHRTDAPELLRAADVFLLPSTNEGLPLSILEAQAANVPVLAAPTAGVPETITHGSTGYLIAADDAVGYAEHVALLLRDSAIRERITHTAAEQVKRESTWETFAKRLLTVYHDLAKTMAS